MSPQKAKHIFRPWSFDLQRKKSCLRHPCHCVVGISTEWKLSGTMVCTHACAYTHTHTHTQFLLLLFNRQMEQSTYISINFFYCCHKQWYVCVPKDHLGSINNSGESNILVCCAPNLAFIFLWSLSVEYSKFLLILDLGKILTLTGKLKRVKSNSPQTWYPTQRSRVKIDHSHLKVKLGNTCFKNIC
jgi:hypothetical protein